MTKFFFTQDCCSDTHKSAQVKLNSTIARQDLNEVERLLKIKSGGRPVCGLGADGIISIIYAMAYENDLIVKALLEHKLSNHDNITSVECTVEKLKTIASYNPNAKIREYLEDALSKVPAELLFHECEMLLPEKDEKLKKTYLSYELKK